jgi:hypothetical protein
LHKTVQKLSGNIQNISRETWCKIFRKLPEHFRKHQKKIKKISRNIQNIFREFAVTFRKLRKYFQKNIRDFRRHSEKHSEDLETQLHPKPPIHPSKINPDYNQTAIFNHNQKELKTLF